MVKPQRSMLYHKQLFKYTHPSTKGNDGGFPEEKDPVAVH